MIGLIYWLYQGEQDETRCHHSDNRMGEVACGATLELRLFTIYYATIFYFLHFESIQYYVLDKSTFQNDALFVCFKKHLIFQNLIFYYILEPILKLFLIVFSKYFCPNKEKYRFKVKDWKFQRGKC